MTIKINLKTALTDEAITRALPNMGACTYSSPCIIGALLSPKQLREVALDYDTESVAGLLHEGIIEFENDKQSNLAIDLQSAFDGDRLHEFNTLVAEIRAL